MKMSFRVAMILIAGVFAINANAALMPVAGGLGVYDSDLDITWLAEGNAGAGSSFDDGASATDGLMTWGKAVDWAASLNVAGFSGWRLPTTLHPDPSCDTQSGGRSFGQNCTGSEMGHMFHVEMGGTAFNSMLNTGDPDLAFFTNLQDGVYWSGTEVAAFPTDADDFNINNGKQFGANKSGEFSAWAVHDGNIGAPVPVPPAVWLFGSALGLLGWARRRKAAS
jgi:hypothetical protein